MLIAILDGSKKNADLVRSADEINAQLVLHSQEPVSAFIELKRTYVDAIIVDLDAFDQEEIYQEIKNYRFVKEKTRIIVIASSEAEQRKLLQKLVALGIYDIVITGEGEAEKEVTRSLQSKPKTLAAAWRWMGEVEKDTDTEKQEKTTTKILKATEQIVYRDRIVGTVIIAVAGVAQGVGCTHFALSTAKYLANNKKKVAIIELNNSPSLETMKEDIKPGEFDLKDITVFPDVIEPGELLKIFQEGFNYVVLDLGLVKWLDAKGEYSYSPWYQELLRADISVVTGFGAIWQIPKLVPFDTHQEPSENWIFILNHSDGQIKEIVSVLKETGFNRVLPGYYSPDPFDFNDKREKHFETVLKGVIETKEKKGLLSRLKK